ncbi:MAG: PhoH family protein [Candidatus Omnitrophota bacterium]
MEKIIPLNNSQEAQIFFGTCDKNIKEIERECGIKISSRGDQLKLKGGSRAVPKAAALVNSLLGSIRAGKHGQLKAVDAYQRQINPKTKGQKGYVEAIKRNDIVFAVGPAGTGKTYLAVWQAQAALAKGLVRRIILVRPAIEAGESLGFLPGDIHAKISPYLRPLYDALYDMLDADTIDKYIATGIIEVAPLAYMRGRTLNDAFIILDEAQNCTADQMKMFLTRLGFDSKTVITGDITQSDLPDGEPTGLLQAQELLSDIKGIKFVYLTGSDVVRHDLVQKIIKAYESANHKK